MPTPKADGHVLTRTMTDVEIYIVERFAQFERIGDQLAEVIADLLDGDNDTREALTTAVELVNKNADLVTEHAKLLHIVTLLARKDFNAAETAAMKLVAGRPEMLE